MNQNERRRFLIEALLRERPACRQQVLPADTDRQKLLLRALMNTRRPAAVSRSFLEVQDAYLQEELSAKGITRLSELPPGRDGLRLWRGDITTLECEAIVNAANSGMTGCYQPCYACVNMGEAYAPSEIAARALCLNADIGDTLSALSLPSSTAPDAGPL